MKKIICLLAVLSLTACGGDDNSASSSNDLKGTFNATMGDKKINVAVKCHSFDGDNFDTAFTFASDNIFGNKDIDGDGFIVRGDRINLTEPMKIDGISLGINDHGIQYDTSSAFMGEFKKNDNGITGTAKLLKEGSHTDTVEITYEVVCK